MYVLSLKFLFDKKFVMRETQKTVTELFATKVILIKYHFCLNLEWLSIINVLFFLCLEEKVGP